MVTTICVLCFRECLSSWSADFTSWSGCRTRHCFCRCNRHCRRCYRRCSKTSSFPLIQVLHIDNLLSRCNFYVFYEGYCTPFGGPCIYAQQAGLLQRFVRWLPCRSADAVLVCPKSSRASCTRAVRPCFSLDSQVQLVTLAELSTASHIQVVLAYLQVPTRPSTVYLSRLCVPTASVSGRSRLRSADDNQLLVLGTQTRNTYLVPERSPPPDLTLGTLCHLSCVIQSSVSLDCFKRSLKSVQFVDLVFSSSRAPV